MAASRLSGYAFAVPNDSPKRGRGGSAVPPLLRPSTDRDQQEVAAITSVEARVRAGLLSGEQADDELLEIALARFSFLPPDAIEEMRAFGREFNEEPEMVATRLRAPTPTSEGRGGEDGSA